VAETVDIIALGHGGDGIAETADGRVFVPWTLPGETVEIDRATRPVSLLGLKTASPDRIDPICRHFGICGGCALQHMERGAYLAWKRQVVADAIAQRGIETEVEPVMPIAEGTRRRAILSAATTPQGFVLGFNRRGTNEIVPIAECPVLVPAIASRLDTLARISKILVDRRRPLRIIVVAADNGLDIAIQGARRVGRPELEALGVLAVDPSLARLTVDNNRIFLNRQPEIRAGDTLLLPEPAGFLQAAMPAEEALAAAVLDHVGGASPVLDLFAGVGTFALRLARRAPVTAVEGDAALRAAITAAANRSKGLKPITTRKRDLFRNPMATIELDAFAAIVFDPPASGARAQVDQIAQSNVPRVAAVSCNPATLARDARLLIDGGYRLTRVRPVDQFLFSAEIEVVAAFER
jgi:23S rRNA (uracil1939-C5)-methyltransferase